MNFQLPRAIEILERTPATLRSMLHGLSETWTAPNEGPGTFSAFDNVAHVVHAERVDWIPRAQMILAQEGDTRFQPFDRFAHYNESMGQSVSAVLAEFAQLRAGNLTTLRGWELTDHELALKGIHPEFGAVTLRELLSAWVVHDLGHTAQIARVMAKQYRQAVGPWRAYLPVLDR